MRFAPFDEGDLQGPALAQVTEIRRQAQPIPLWLCEIQELARLTGTSVASYDVEET